MDKYDQLKEVVEYVVKVTCDLPFPYLGPDGENDYPHVVRLIMKDLKDAMEKIDAGSTPNT
jgi:hypothetical protein